ncbi:AAA family ATPase [Methylobacterium sp. CM6257]
MRVAGVEIEGHPALGSLALDFRDAAGRAPSTVVIAGENGCGKTAVLETIFLALGPDTYEPVRAAPSFRATVFVEPHRAIADTLRGNHSSVGPAEETSPWHTFDGIGIRLFFPEPSRRDVTLERYLWAPASGNVITFPETVRTTLGDLGCFLSEANTTFKVPTINSATGKVQRPEDHKFQNWMRGGSQLAEEIAQLIVDLRTADNNDAADWLRNTLDGRPSAETIDRRIGPLTEAFGRLFEGKTFAGLDSSEGNLTPVFEQFGRRMPLAKLSTGEKQVVFRGAFLLREAEALERAVVLVDEPELSLHPTWQSKVLPFYEAIIPKTGDAHNQLIVATHSPFVVHGSPLAKHIILKRDPTGQVTEDPTPSFAGITPEDVAIAAFDLSSSVFSSPGNRMVVVTEGRTDAEILRTAWTRQRPGQPMPFNLMSAGGAKSVRSFLGAETDTMGPLADALSDSRIDRFLALFDFDREGYEQWNGMITAAKAETEDLAAACAYRKRRGASVWAALLPVPPFRPSYAGFSSGLKSRSRLTIELLFEDTHVRPLLVEEEVPGVPGAAVLVAPDSQKATIAAATATFPPSAFAAFEPIFALVDHVLAYVGPA